MGVVVGVIVGMRVVVGGGTEMADGQGRRCRTRENYEMNDCTIMKVGWLIY